jgi:hypothetical protein
VLCFSSVAFGSGISTATIAFMYILAIYCFAFLLFSVVRLAQRLKQLRLFPTNLARRIWLR